MKHILTLIVVLISINTTSGKEKIERLPIKRTFEKIIEFPGKDKAELFTMVDGWAKTILGGSTKTKMVSTDDKVMLTRISSNVEAGKLLGAIYTGIITSDITVRIKDGKVKILVEFYSSILYTNSSGTNRVKLSAYNNPKGSLFYYRTKDNNILAKGLEKDANLTIRSLEKYNASEELENDW